MSKYKANITVSSWPVLFVNSSIASIFKEKNRYIHLIHFYLKFIFSCFASSNHHGIYSENIAINDICPQYINQCFFQWVLILFLGLTANMELVIFYIDNRLFLLKILNQPFFICSFICFLKPILLLFKDNFNIFCVKKWVYYLTSMVLSFRKITQQFLLRFYSLEKGFLKALDLEANQLALFLMPE